jgi:hypothetical protein
MKPLLVAFLFCLACSAQAQDTNAHLFKDNLSTENRSVSILGGDTVKLSAANGSGVAWINDVTFDYGSIEIDLRGKNVPQGSFLGIAFHGMTANDCEVVYFRPFNFVARDKVAKTHMVQYVYDTTYSWQRLRDEHPGVYEHQLAAPPKPDAWFHVRVAVQGHTIKVYVNGATTPSLVVTSLKERMDNRIGLWVGNGSDGDFANLKVSPRKFAQELKY